MAFRSYTEIKCWQDASLLFQEIHALFNSSRELNNEFAIKDQIMRASLSVMNNIAEGFGRFSNKEFLRFLNIARGSCYEVESMVYAIKTIGLISEADCIRLLKVCNSVRKNLGGLSKYLKSTL